MFNSLDCSVELSVAVLEKMNRDDVADIAKNDTLILTLGSILLSGKGQKKAHLVSQTMRLLSRLVMQLRSSVDGMAKASLMDFITPMYFEAIVSATKDIAGYKQITKDGELLPTFHIASLPLKIGYALENAALLMHGMGLKQNNQVLQDNASKFSILYKVEWSIKIFSASLRTLGDNKFNKLQLLPTTEDLVKLKKFCEDSTLHSKAELKSSPSLNNWRELAEVTIARILVFNKRRGDEPSNLLIQRYESRHNYAQAVHSDIQKSLSPLEKQLMHR